MPIAALVLATGMIAMSVTQEKWHLYLSYGVLVGLGMVAVGTVPNYTVIQNWFRRYRGVAMGAASAGIGLGLLLIVPAAQMPPAATGRCSLPASSAVGASRRCSRIWSRR